MHGVLPTLHRPSDLNCGDGCDYCGRAVASCLNMWFYSFNQSTPALLFLAKDQDWDIVFENFSNLHHRKTIGLCGSPIPFHIWENILHILDCKFFPSYFSS